MLLWIFLSKGIIPREIIGMAIAAVGAVIVQMKANIVRSKKKVISS
jgi:hypothetical protein